MLPVESYKFLANAYGVAGQSRDASNQNGSVLVNAEGEMTTGVNNFPPGVAFTEERATTRPKKYRYFEHAERWSIYQAARVGRTSYGSTLYCPWVACCDCARAMIVAGVKKVVAHHERMLMTPDRWQDDVYEALSMLGEGGVDVLYYEGPIKTAPILVNGELWRPDTQPVTNAGNWYTPMGT